jgi:hypothetical protein
MGEVWGGGGRGHKYSTQGGSSELVLSMSNKGGGAEVASRFICCNII